MSNPSPDAVLETLDAGELVDELIRLADRVDTQATSLCRQADRIATDLNEERAPRVRRFVYECEQTRSLMVEERALLRRYRDRLNQSGVVHITPEGLRRALIGFLGWGLLIFVGVGIIMAGG